MKGICSKQFNFMVAKSMAVRPSLTAIFLEAQLLQLGFVVLGGVRNYQEGRSLTQLDNIGVHDDGSEG